ncbi:4'-phosphopantetheinyl transferase superfamily protein [Ramlibacter sp. WS9]|uniref:4'-phosphopantetheinyl transferase superfamily protein n=1 Tax=Ramlibacter sp. WS9 TaxID=1882741 RepID=UPI001143FF7E|nr:4'-phosphopantetheinyl transferase superfamily protein [Ramlibacter sp. WS9]ROZ76041.1 4'-phosphopantetheinyl transferase superfamily protein [Ramlibacter sp. WS9]
MLNVVLGEDERNRTGAFHFEKDAFAYAAAHALLRSDAERFNAFWTLKEALLNAKGPGLNHAPSTFSVDRRSMRAAVPAVAPAMEPEPVHEWHWRAVGPRRTISFRWRWMPRITCETWSSA